MLKYIFLIIFNHFHIHIHITHDTQILIFSFLFSDLFILHYAKGFTAKVCLSDRPENRQKQSHNHNLYLLNYKGLCLITGWSLNLFYFKIEKKLLLWIVHHFLTHVAPNLYDFNFTQNTKDDISRNVRGILTNMEWHGCE